MNAEGHVVGVSDRDNRAPGLGGGAADRLAPPPPALLWLMRGLALAGAAIAGFLTWTALAGRLATGASAAPLCGGPSWLDCASVLNSRWAEWLGVPVAAIATGVYAVMALSLFGVGRRSPHGLRRASWALLVTFAAAVAVSAGWFIYVQAAIVDRWCSYCTLEHGLGLMLAALVAVYGGTALRWRAALPACIVGLAGAAGLIAGQWFNPPQYTEPVAWQASGETYREPVDDPGDTVRLFDGRIVLNADAHPRLGAAHAERFFVEVLDFSCYRCAKAQPLIREALERLGPTTALLIVFSPLDTDCNRHIARQHEAHRFGCELVRIAAAVWLTDREAYADFHRWLFAEQEGMTPDKAREEAARRVGGDRLESMLAEPRLAKLIQRDIALTAKLDLRGLPGLIAADARFTALPEDPRELARLIADAWREASPE